MMKEGLEGNSLDSSPVSHSNDNSGRMSLGVKVCRNYFLFSLVSKPGYMTLHKLACGTKFYDHQNHSTDTPSRLSR